MIDVSVLITCFNKEKYLTDCIESIKRQTKEPKEIIIVHDACKGVGIHLEVDNIVLHQNLGVSKARDAAFKLSSGELILFVDGDDVLSPDYLEKMTLVLAKGADVAYPDIYHWAGKESRLVVLPKKITPKFVQDYQKVVMPVTCLMKRKVYEIVGGFKEWPVLEDLDFWVTAMCKGYTFKKAETLLWYRRTPETRNTMDIIKRREILKQILAQFVFKDGEIYGKNQL
jgi:glycosyltransferase involved in cell wall biosynthesis